MRVYWKTGNGINCRHRNQLVLGCFGREHRLGVRAVFGYSSSLADETDNFRKYDESRVFTGARNKKGMVIIAHKSGVLADCDVIYRVVEGKLMPMH